MRDDMDERREPYLGPLDLPDEHDVGDEASALETPSLFDEISTLVGDGKTYAEAELAFQKSRASFVADRAKGLVLYGIGAVILVHLGLIALSVGLVFALIPLVGPWGATAIVAGLLLAGAALLAMKLRGRLAQISSAFGDKS